MSPLHSMIMLVLPLAALSLVSQPALCRTHYLSRGDPAAFISGLPTLSRPRWRPSAARRIAQPSRSVLPLSAAAAVQSAALKEQNRVGIPRPGVLKELIYWNGRRIVLGFLFAFVGSVVTCSLPLAFTNVLNVLLTPAPLQEFTKACAILGSLYVLEPICTLLYVRQATRVVQAYLNVLKATAFQSVVSRNIEFFDREGPSNVANLLTTSFGRVRDCLLANIDRQRGVRALLDCVIALSILISTAPQLAWLFGLVIPIMAFTVNRVSATYQRTIREESTALTAEASAGGEILRNIREVRSFGTEQKENDRYGRFVARSGAFARRVGMARGRVEAVTRAAIYSTLLSLAIVGGTMVRRGTLVPTTLVSFIGFSFTLNFAFQGLLNSLEDVRGARAALQTLWDTIGLPEKDDVLDVNVTDSVFHHQGDTPLTKAQQRGQDLIRPSNTTMAAPSARRRTHTFPGGTEELQGRIRFDNVGFAYSSRPDSPVLRNLSLSLPPGKVTAIVGPSGGGKSTIASLLSRFYRPQSGSVLLDGVDISTLPRDWYVEEVAIVGQTPALFSGTVAENIAYGVVGRGREVTQADIEKAAKQANCHDFIMRFPNKYETLVGEMGSTLSGGQRQRIAIARALLKDSKILILDEATSALDATSERLVQEALDRLVKGRTVMVIAHRLSTVQNADQICVVKDGQVVECGTHESLLAAPYGPGVYRKLMGFGEKPVVPLAAAEKEEKEAPPSSFFLDEGEEESSGAVQKEGTAADEVDHEARLLEVAEQFHEATKTETVCKGEY